MENTPDPDEGFVLFVEESQDHESKHLHSNATMKHSPKGSEEAEYILGTIIVRVIAARGLTNPNQYDSGFGRVFRNTSALATVNPYASVKFGKTTQRTSDVYSTTDPLWPRDEVFFMDVSLPVSQLTHCSESSISDGTISPLASSENMDEVYIEDPYNGYNKPDNTTLTVAIFHTEMENTNRKHTLYGDENIEGDSDDVFLGMASIDLTRLFTGKVSELDEWLSLSGTSTYNDGCRNSDNKPFKKEGNNGASVRVMCEYEVSDLSPKAGDICRFTRFCHPKDLFPLEPALSYKVDEVHNNHEFVLLSHQSEEGWLLSFQAHKNMLICEERHASVLNTAQDELQTLGERLSVSPLVKTVKEAAEKVVDDGVVGITEGIIRGSVFVFDRWFKGGVDTIIQDVQDITNLDGRYNVGCVNQHLDLDNPSSSSCSHMGDNNEDSGAAIVRASLQQKEAEALPNMPSCPITGFPMVDPVVAADGHTYERSAITRWLKTSNKSPMTGSVLFHKELVSNYGLLSSIQDVTALVEKSACDTAKCRTNANEL